LQQLADIAKANEDRVFRNFSPEELEAFHVLLDKLYGNLGGLQSPVSLLNCD
jgi:hypothetical protein